MRQLKTVLQESIFDIDDKSINDKIPAPRTKRELQKMIFKACENANRGETVDLNWIFTGYIKDMSDLFSNNKILKLNFDISRWDVSNVEDMEMMFYGCTNFNCDLSHWQVDKVNNMRFMFYDCEKLDCDLSQWRVKRDARMAHMFEYCTKINKPNWYNEASE